MLSFGDTYDEKVIDAGLWLFCDTKQLRSNAFADTGRRMIENRWGFFFGLVVMERKN